MKKEGGKEGNEEVYILQVGLDYAFVSRDPQHIFEPERNLPVDEVKVRGEE
jgi:hypothetical protein